MLSPTQPILTPPRVPLVDPRTGLIDRAWYLFFLSLNRAVTEVIDESGITFSAESTIASVEAELQALAQFAETLPPVVALPAPDALTDCCSGLESQIAEMQKQVEGLQMAPPPRQFAASRYGSFYDTTTQTATVINTATAITFNTTDLSNGVFIGTPTSRIIVDTEGLYNFAISFQIDKTSGGVAEFYVWFRLNGVDVANSAGLIRIQGNNAEIFSAYNLFLSLKANDYVEVMFSINDLSVELLAVPATAPVPGIPSIILTVNNNIGGFQ
jgi:hypothetical protein